MSPALQVDSLPLSHLGILTGCLQKGSNAAGFSNTGVAWVRTLSLPPHRRCRFLKPELTKQGPSLKKKIQIYKYDVRHSTLIPDWTVSPWSLG